MRAQSSLFAQETAAIHAIKTIHSAEVHYYAQYGKFAASLAELGPPASGTPNESAAGLIGNDLAQATKQGYRYTITCTPGGYLVNATRESFETTGSNTPIELLIVIAMILVTMTITTLKLRKTRMGADS